MEELEKRIECNKPGIVADLVMLKRFEENFKNWTSGNKDIDEFIQQSQLNAVHWKTCLEWIPFEKFQNVTYITRGGLVKFIQLTGLKDVLIIGILKIKSGREIHM